MCLTAVNSRAVEDLLSLHPEGLTSEEIYQKIDTLVSRKICGGVLSGLSRAGIAARTEATATEKPRWFLIDIRKSDADCKEPDGPITESQPHDSAAPDPKVPAESPARSTSITEQDIETELQRIRSAVHAKQFEIEYIDRKIALINSLACIFGGQIGDTLQEVARDLDDMRGI